MDEQDLRQLNLSIAAIAQGRAVQRYHTTPTLRPQSVGDHSFGVAMLASLIAMPTIGVSVPLLMAALTHDMAEVRYGDVPSPAKRAVEAKLPGFRALYGQLEQEYLKEREMDWEAMLSADEKAVLKCADYLDGMMYCIQERLLGNRGIAEVFTNFSLYFRAVEIKHVPTNERARHIYASLCARWENIDA